MPFLRDLLKFLSGHKRYWLLPALLVLIVFGVLIALGSGSTDAPFVYAPY